MWLIPQSKKEIMNKQLLVFRRLQCFVGTTFASFPAILIIISSLHQFANKQYFLLLKNQQMLSFFLKLFLICIW